MKRLLAVLVFLAGLALAFGYPLLSSLPPLTIGTWPLYRPSTGFTPVAADLDPDQAPVEVYVDAAMAGAPKFENDSALLTLTASTDGRTALAVPLTFVGAVEREDSPQTPERIYRARAGTIDRIDPAAAAYRFTAGPGDAEGIAIASVDLVLEKGLPPADSRAQPIGFALIAAGAVAFLLTLRGGGDRPPSNPNSQPPPPRWGRGAAER
jgi:hypothetical protein